MGLFGLFQSNEEKLRSKIRTSFDECVERTVRENGDIIKEPMFGGMMIQAAIGSLYQSLKDEPTLSLLADKLGVNYSKILEEECQRALNKYLE